MEEEVLNCFAGVLYICVDGKGMGREVVAAFRKEGGARGGLLDPLRRNGKEGGRELPGKGKKPITKRGPIKRRNNSLTP